MAAVPPTPGRLGSPEQVAPVTDFALIESQKENIRPLAGGRSAATLSVLFEKTDEAERVVQEGIAKFQRDIEEAERRDREGEDMVDGIQDVLDVYNHYIAFLSQHFPASPGNVLPTLESTTRRFVDDARYSQDARYLKLWVMYARQVERREEVWSYLESRDIGTRHAQFYEEWATALEGLGRKKKADDVYRLGIARKSAPLERLKNRHQSFLQRIMVPPSGVVPDDPPEAAVAPRQRSVLGQVSSGSSGVSGATQTPGSSRISTSRNGAKMAIFSDASATAEQPDATPWDDFGTRDGRRKENTVEATPWKGETIKQGRPVAPRTPKLEVFKDSNNNASAVHSAEGVLGGLRPKAPPTEAELLRADPLKNFDTSDVPSTVPQLPTLPAPPSARKPPAKKHKRDYVVGHAWECPTEGAETLVNGKKQRRMFDWDATFRGGEEWSFQEVRARKMGLLGKDWKELKEWESGWHKPGASTPQPQRVAPPRAPSPTVNTKLANEEVMSLFNQTIHGGKVRNTDFSDDSSSDEDDGEAADEVAALPTPLPPRQQSSMMTPGGMVPPTPTPAPGARMGLPQQPQLLNIFADENAAPSSVRKLNIFADENAPNDENAVPSSSRRSVFTETPARAPLSARTPLASSSKPPAFSVFTGEIPGEHRAVSPPVEQPEQQAAEEPHEYAEHNADDPMNGPGDYEESDDEHDIQLRHFGKWRGMTPITERTLEYTTGRSSGRTSLISESGEEITGTQPPVDSLAAVMEEDERSSSARSSARPSPAPAQQVVVRSRRSSSGRFDPTSDYSYHSGSVDTGAFNVPEGFTIQRDLDTAATMMHNLEVVDRNVVSEAVPTGELELPELSNPCNPGDDSVIQTLLQRIDPPLSSLPMFVDCRDVASGRLATLQKAAKTRPRRSSTASNRTSIAPADAPYVLELGDTKYEICGKLGEGGFGAVFLGDDVRAKQAWYEEGDDDDENDDHFKAAIKVERPCAVWEAVVLERVHHRVSAPLATSIIRPRGLHAYSDESFLVLDYSSQGTLLDVVNKANAYGVGAIPNGPSSPEELIGLFFIAELLRLVEGLHAADIIHGDLKIDNCLVRLDPIENSKWSVQYERSGDGGWGSKGVRLIDFGRAQDLTLFAAGRSQRFVADWNTDERDCIEMREGRPWSYETDYFGLASIAYCLLFGKYIGTEAVVSEDGQKRYKIDAPLKRYWQQDLWNKLFDTLLNPGTIGELPITNHLASIRGEIETYLEENCDKNGKNLKQMLKRIERNLAEQQR